MMRLTTIILTLAISSTALCQDDSPMRYEVPDIFRLDGAYGNVTQLGVESPADAIVVPAFASSNRGYWSFSASHQVIGRLFMGLNYTTVTGDWDTAGYRAHMAATNPDHVVLGSAGNPNGISAIAAELSYQIPIGPVFVEPGVNAGYSWIAPPVASAFLKERESNLYSSLDIDGDVAWSTMLTPMLTIRYFAHDVREGRGRAGLILRAEYFTGRYAITTHRTERIAPHEPQTTTTTVPFRYEALRIGIGVSIIL
jgi:hypothetical protein